MFHSTGVDRPQQAHAGRHRNMIARTHELRPKIPRGPFTSGTDGKPYSRYQPNFFPMLPVLLALGWSVGGDQGIFLVGPLLGLLALGASVGAVVAGAVSQGRVRLELTPAAALGMAVSGAEPVLRSVMT